MCAIPRFYESMRRCGAQSIQLVLDEPKEWVLGPEPERNAVMTAEGISGYLVESARATLIVTYASGSTVFSRGSCRALYHYHQQEQPQEHEATTNYLPQTVLLLSQLEYDFVEHTEMISRSAIKTRDEPSGALRAEQSKGMRAHSQTEEAAQGELSRPAKRPKFEAHSGSENDAVQHVDQSPVKPLPLQKEYDAGFRQYSIPCPPVRDTGLSDETMRVLEVRLDCSTAHSPALTTVTSRADVRIPSDWRSC